MATDMNHISMNAAIDSYRNGFTPVPIVQGSKRPGTANWTRLSYSDEEDVRTRFTEWCSAGQTNLGIVLGEASSNLVDVDIDHPKARRLRDYFLPYTAARSGRAGARGTHYWYICKDGTTPGSTRQHLMQRGEDGKRGETAVELRTNLSQSLVPPSIHPTGEEYLWEGEPWGGEQGPEVVDGKMLAARVAMLGLATVLLDNWPQAGSRHDAYLSLAGGLLRYGDTVHPFWGHKANAAEQLIRALAEASNDADGADTRIAESVGTTIANIQSGKKVRGFPSLAEAIGDAHVDQVRVLVAEVEQAAGFISRQSPVMEVNSEASATSPSPTSSVDKYDLPPDERDPLAERLSTWVPVDLDPYLFDRVKPVEPTVLVRDDGASLMYPGRVNMLFGTSESAKSWIALWTTLQVISTGERAVYLDFEDEPVNTLARLKALGASPDDVRKRLAYIRPEDPISAMQRDRFGRHADTGLGRENQDLFSSTVDGLDPTLIVADGMSVIYGLHGLNTNDTVETEVITSWLKSLTRNGRTTVIVIDHTPKGNERGTLPIGSQHKTAMVQGTLIQAYPVRQPMPGQVGEIELITVKDRPGFVRSVSQPLTGGNSQSQLSAQVRMDSSVDGVTLFNIFPPGQANQNTQTSVQIDARQSELAGRLQRAADCEKAVLEAFDGDMETYLSKADLNRLLCPTLLSTDELDAAIKALDGSKLAKTDRHGVPDENQTRYAHYKLRSSEED